MNRELTIDGQRIADDTDCYVIAEIGHNHQGDLDKARQLFLRAKECGVHAVKLQKRDNRSLYTAAMYARPYENENSFGRTYGEHREFLEFERDEYVELRRYAKELGLTFFATAFDAPSADFLQDLDMPAFKLASGDLRNVPLLRHVAAFQKPVIISTGGASLDDVQRAHDVFCAINPQLCILQCTASYPTEPEEMNLRVIETFRARFPSAVIGLSDHHNGIAMSVVAYMVGARVIEKHFTLNHTWKGTDHALSLEPTGMQKMIRDLQRVRVALGDDVKRVLPSEAGAIGKMGKKLVASRRLPGGHRLTAADVSIKSPGDGLAPTELDQVLGRRTRGPLEPDDNITLELLDQPVQGE
ncbi:MAG TPA: N-acetylneuraminate synthase family protein [Gemmatimonadaceae bacterium]|nr:N-acetylneuraminate synthase family protein [Gemmatimonadaceae bacterium]